jgi:tRNA threonylcarbamoyladenosine biosynthesis protein TsaE
MVPRPQDFNQKLNSKGPLIRALEEESLTIHSDSDQDTIRVGQAIGALLLEGDVVGLAGELGSGKTWLTKGIALGLGVNPKTIVTSPSFTLVNEYPGRPTLFHIDVYRLNTLEEVLSAGIEETIHSGGVVVLEWADRWPEILPEQALMVNVLILDDHRRTLLLSGRHARPLEIISQIKMAAPRS